MKKNACAIIIIFLVFAIVSISCKKNATEPDEVIPLDGRGGGVICFYSERDDNSEIYIMNADGSAETRLTNNNISDFAPNISQDGSKIVFVSNRDGNDEIYTMNIDGSTIARITNNTVTDSYPFWSSDGAKIIYCSQIDDGITYEIYFMDQDGSNKTRLTNNSISEEFAYFSPDMQNIIYSIGPFPDYNIYIMEINGGNQYQFFDSENGCALPKWSIDGLTVSFNQFRLNSNNIVGDIYLIGSDGNNLTQITNSGNNVISENPYWSPDGNRIMFQSNRTGMFQLYSMDSTGEDIIRLTQHSGNDFWPSWGQ